jgi:hypothetical protein
MPKAMMSYQQRTGTNIPGVNELVLECGKWMKMLKTDYETARNTLEYHRVHIQQFIPMNSKKSVVATFKNDGLYNHRIARMSEFLMRNVSFASTTKHAETFMTLLTTNNFRSLFLWSKDETGRRQTCLNYDVIESLPKDLKMFIEEERKRHEEEFNKYPRKKSFNPQLWMRTIRKIFCNSVAEAFKKALEVERLGRDYPWSDEIERYGLLQNSMNRLSDCEEYDSEDLPENLPVRKDQSTMTLDPSSSSSSSRGGE